MVDLRRLSVACVLLGLWMPLPALAQLTLENEDFSVALGGRFQVGYNYRHDDPERTRFLFEQNRIELELEAFGVLLGELALDVASNDGYPEAKDLWLGFDGLEWLLVRAGQFKVPTSRQRLVSGTRMLFVERPGLADFVRARELGAAVKVHTPLEHYSAEVGAFNGMGENTTREDAEGFPLLSFRIEAMPLALLEGGEGDVARSPEPALALGAHVAYTQDALADDEEPSLTRIDGARLQYGGDIAFKWAGFYFGGEFVGAWYRPDSGAEWFGAGWLLQSSYYVAPIRCEAAVRYDELNPSDQLDDDRKRTLSFGLNAYPFESNAFKLQASYALAFEGRDDDLTFLVQLAYP